MKTIARMCGGMAKVLAMGAGILILPACGGGSGGGGVPDLGIVDLVLQVVDSVPQNLEENVSRTGLVYVKFNRDIDPATLTDDSFRLVEGGNPVTVVIAYDPVLFLASLAPTPPLKADADYTVILSDAVADADGVPLEPHSFSFATTALTDLNAPAFAGLSAAVGGLGGTVELAWAPAADPPNDSTTIVYDIFVATASGAQDFSQPVLTTAPGDLEASVAGLAPLTVHYFVVRARDAAGNAEANLVEATAIPLP